ncbi:MAG: phosphate ABC transporter ATP-binding protein [Rhodospirillaceae bacterium]
MASLSNILPLSLSGVEFEADGIRLIKDVSTEFKAGSLSFVLGPNGAGKSLLLRLCHGLIEPTAGSVTWQGPAAEDPQPHQAMVFQRPVMLRRSVYANLDHALCQRNVDKAERVSRIEEMLERTGLRRLAKVSARRLSGGEQQRLSVARAWTLQPEVLFLDEPTAALDPSATHAIEEFIQAIRASGTTVIMSSHDMAQARRLADDVLFMYRGRLIERSPAQSFFDKPESELAQSFLQGNLLWWKRKELTPPDAG